MLQGRPSQRQNAVTGSDELFTSNSVRMMKNIKLGTKCTTNKWKGTGLVIGQDGVMVFVRHSSTYVRVHHSRLEKVDPQQTVQTVVETQQVEAEGKVVLPHSGPSCASDYDTESVEEMMNHRS